jgi:hypothetical protein
MGLVKTVFYAVFIFFAMIYIGAFLVGFYEGYTGYGEFEEEFVVEAGYVQPYYLTLDQFTSTEMFVEANTPINLYLLDSFNFEKFEAGEGFDYYDLRSNAVKARLVFEAPYDDTYYIVFETGDTEAHINFRYILY